MKPHDFVRCFWILFLYTSIHSCQQTAARNQPTTTVNHKAYKTIVPLLNAYAHNDYWQKRPLHDALENGYTHIEVDIFKVADEFVVAHLIPFFRQGKTLENMYLQPLYDRIQKNKGFVYPGYSQPITLMVDIKLNGESTYRALKRLLKRYKSVLTSYENGVLVERQITVVLSGSKPFQQLPKEKVRYAFIDEDLKKIQTSKYNNKVCPIASCKFSSLIQVNEDGSLALSEKQKLMQFVIIAHQQGKKVRLWATPEKEILWNELLECGVDLINTDRLVSLKTFLVNRTQTEKVPVVSIHHSSPTVLADRK
jgi:hypothetical protein